MVRSVDDGAPEVTLNAVSYIEIINVMYFIIFFDKWTIQHKKIYTIGATSSSNIFFELNNISMRPVLAQGHEVWL